MFGDAATLEIFETLRTEQFIHAVEYFRFFLQQLSKYL
jgi:hypothetical protein